MSVEPAAAPEPDPADLETLLFGCLDAAESEREAVLADACRRHPELAEPLRRCWQRIGRLQPSGGMPTQVAGHRILRRLGGGGMGVVYLAEQERLGRKVALKLIRSDLLESEEAGERFQREAQAASRVEHPGLCPVWEVGEAEGVPYMVMPYLEGITLAARIAELAAAEGPPSSAMSSARRDLVSVLAAVARAVHHAHEHGLVHRDIKPGNIMLLPDGRPMLLDFGLARDAAGEQPTLTRTGERVGTPAYMAPEQLRGDGEAIDQRTDVYALGVVLYEVVMLERPFACNDLLELREQVQSGIRPAKLRRRVPYDLASVILKAAAPEPARRYPTAAAFADDLDHFARLEPVSARRLSVVGQSTRWIRRHPLVSALLLALAVAFGVAAAALRTSLQESRRFQALALLGDSRAEELTDTRLALEHALAADRVDPTPRSLVQLNRALQGHRELRRFEVDNWVWWLAFGPDHRRVYVASVTGGLHAFDVASGREVANVRVPLPPGKLLRQGAVAPDGTFLVVGTTAQQAVLWRFGDDEAVPFATAHGGRVSSVAISADSRTIYTAAEDGTVGRFGADGKPAGPFPWLATSPGPTRVVARPDGGVVVVGSAEDAPELVIAPAGGGDPSRFPLPGRAAGLSYAPATGRLWLEGVGNSGLFDLNGAAAALDGMPTGVTSGGLSPRGDRLALAHGDSLRVFELDPSRGIADLGAAPFRDVPAGDAPVTLVEFAGDRLFAFASDQALHVYTEAGSPCLQLPGFSKAVTSLDLDPATATLVTGDGAGSVRLWDVRMERDQPPERRIPGLKYNGLETGAAGRVIARAGDGRLAVFPADGSAPRIVEGHGKIMDDSRLDRDGRRLATGGRDGVARVFDVETMQVRWQSPPENARVVGVDFLPDDRLLVVLGANPNRPYEFQIWRLDRAPDVPDVPEGRWLLSGQGGSLNHGAATPDGRHVVLASVLGVVYVVPLQRDGDEVTFGEPITIQHKGPVLHIEVDATGDRFVAACADNRARVYDLGGNLLSVCEGHDKRVVIARFSPRGNRIVTASQDGTARVWDAATGEQLTEIVVGAPSPVWDARWGPEDDLLYTVSIDGVIRGWLLDRDALRRMAGAALSR